MKHNYTKEQIDFIEKNVVGIGNEKLTLQFNQRFGTNLRTSQIKAAKHNRRLSSGLDGRFLKGHVTWNKGAKGLTGPNKTSFKKGLTPYNHLPVGSEVIDSDGYVKIKIAEPNKWMFKHRLLWEEEHGKIPKGMCLIFMDSNKQNLELKNLRVVSRRELLILNRKGLISTDSNITESGLLIAKVLDKSNQINSERNEE